MSRSRKATWFLVVIAPIGIVVAAREPAGAQTAPQLTGVTIAGDALVGSTLTAVPEPAEAAVTEYQWRRCIRRCRRIGGATASTYTVSDADIGSQLQVRASAPSVLSPRTAIVPDPNPTPTPTPTPTPAPTPAPTPEPTPEPQPEPEPDPPADSERPDEHKAFEQTGRQAPPPAVAVPATELAVRPLAYLRPFPVVRVKGVVLRRGARITLLRVRAPATAIVDVRCHGPGCRRVRRRAYGTRRIRALERFLPAGARITIRVYKRDAVGKYVRLVIRGGAPPKRRDACVVAHHLKPAECPRP